MATQNADPKWDPKRTFVIHSLGSCAGEAVTTGNPECGQRIKCDEARQALDTIAIKDPSSPAIAKMLMNNIIPPFLCDRWHRNKRNPFKQRSRLFSDWSVKIQRLLRQQWNEMSRRELRQALDRIYREYYAAQPALARVQMRLEKRQHELERVQQDFDARSVVVASEVTDLQSELREARRRLAQSSASDRISSPERDLESTNDTVEETEHQLQERNLELQNQLSSAAARISSLERDLESIQESAKDTLEETQHTISSLERDLERTNHTLQEAQRQLQDHESSAAPNQTIKRPLDAFKQYLDAFKQRSIRLLKSVIYPPRIKYQDLESG
ncbi:hypothetical protein MMC07_002321 [Pseudocyphellaria aurata]|nr:hypothetical protein [Pseudocyphellaria aurata]